MKTGFSQALANPSSCLPLECDPYRTIAEHESDSIGNPSQRTLTGCPYCGAQVELILAEQAAKLCRVSRRRIYCWIEAGTLHFQELADGAVLVCTRSLLDRVEQHECATIRLPAAPAA